jgi:lysophospholipase L1-like esterase
LLFTLLIGLTEIVIRLCVPERLWAFHAAKDDWQMDPEIGWVNKPDLDTQGRCDGVTVVRFRTDANGVQSTSSARSAKSNIPTIMLFGDSTIVGRSVPEEHRLAFCLERLLRQNGIESAVVCAGVQGYSTDQSLLLMRRLLPVYKPQVVIHMVCDNDLPGNVLSEAYGLPKPCFTLTASNSLELRRPDLDLARWKSASKPRHIRDVIQHSAVYRLTLPAITRLRYNSNPAERQLVGLAGAETSPEFIARTDWKLFRALVGDMKRTCDENGAVFILTQHPSLSEVWLDPKPEKNRYLLQSQLQAATDSCHAAFCPVVSFFVTNRSQGPFHLLPRDPHCNAKGYELMATRLASFLDESGSSRKFVSTSHTK